jgi:hypothetical protein
MIVTVVDSIRREESGGHDDYARRSGMTILKKKKKATLGRGPYPVTSGLLYTHANSANIFKLKTPTLTAEGFRKVACAEQRPFDVPTPYPHAEKGLQLCFQTFSPGSFIYTLERSVKELGGS